MDKQETPGSQLLKLKALSDTTRLDIINLLSSGPLCACDILESFQITQPTLSYHMKLLTESGLVSSERTGKWMHYTLNCSELEDLLGYLKQLMVSRNVPLVKSSANCEQSCNQTKLVKHN
ncbi:ArsR/SmtB family transcription factor [Sphaerochaeta halotolerans]|jgi:ArsR family transcriptional regulator|uniref:ArsR family transcriptional regulator n=1 Tax=Sphaerochaeta halotolerans TaxID=2293840 RepID=A0A372MFB1_9SPIR|nr:metalloregulator ArsR/SmtB family transcription factor [Sphaerochaeta halotolerans]MBG0766870.1 winged helix-turn-helix transcriptional regulator [Spirochaetaceae bacterium]MXI86703.1 metalloregulator ArsR/SmtB family transcription factor [Sphaerochaeta halotolerans]RFU94467.1 ArsR family transcriptional regulator [Sphaerochaeta halotolerans]